jgi:hypothetical protein
MMLRRGATACFLAMLWCVGARGDDAEDAAVRAVERLGGRVVRDERAKGRPVVGVDLHGTATTDADLKILLAFAHLRDLDLGQTRITDAGLQRLGCLPELCDLTLSNTTVTDDGLKALLGLPHLTSLQLSCTVVSDEGMKRLTKLRRLQTLNVAATCVTGVGAAVLREALPRCSISYD